MRNKTIDDSTTIRRTLQAAVDHYPQLAAFQLTLRSGDQHQQEPEDFLQALQQQLDILTQHRQGERKATQPTLLYALWSQDAEGNIPLLLMLNQNAFAHTEEITDSFRQVWHELANMPLYVSETIISLDRSNTRTFSAQFSALHHCATQLVAPVYTIRSTRNTRS